ncbi:MAG: hypothetical protein ACLU4N_21265 [Butyricimonas faecihominis]
MIKKNTTEDQTENTPSDKIYYAPYGMPDLETVGWGDYAEIRALKDYQSDMQEKTLVSYFARLEYGFREKYLFLPVSGDDGVHVRENNRWGTFPSVAAAWSFRKNLSETISVGIFWKIRASWGRSGCNFPKIISIRNYERGSTSYLEIVISNPNGVTGFIMTNYHGKKRTSMISG